MNNTKRAIEESFPIVEINKLAVPERNAFKPIYTMHKWFARRSSSVFRAILLAAMKPAGTDIMEEFYKDHTNDPDTNGKVILDPFMGGGTTVVEALRLGCKVIGIDLNPVAWFIVKTEVEPVDIDELKKSFERLSNRIVSWSGKALKETLLDLYKTECPSCGNKDADIIYTFWVKSAPCTTGTCEHQTPLFSDYIIAYKKPSIRYYEDSECPECNKKFDWEIEPAALIGNKSLMINATQFSAGIGRASARWAFAPEKSKTNCPWCSKSVTPIVKNNKKKRKKVPLNVLFCPSCEEVWQYRGELKTDSMLECPTCKHSYNPNEGNLPAKGKFICRGTCNGNVDAIISAIRKLPKDQLLPVRPYAIEGYCELCSGNKNGNSKKEKFFEMEEDEDIEVTDNNSSSILVRNNGKFFKRFTSQDLAKYQQAKEIWEQQKSTLPYPKSEIPIGEKTKSGLIAHHYNYWYQMFNERQLLALSTLLSEIDKEKSQNIKEMLLSLSIRVFESNNLFTWYNKKRYESEGIFTRHDYSPKVNIPEGNIWGTAYGKNSIIKSFDKIIEGKNFCYNPFDRIIRNNTYEEFVEKVYSNEKVIPSSDEFDLHSNNAMRINSLVNSEVDFVITDPPYSGNVNYSELSDFFYVWLRLILKSTYSQFQPEISPKVEEIVENRTRGKSANDFKEGLCNVFKECFKISKDSSSLIFTFHHAEDTAWEALLDSVCFAGYYIEAVYPIHGEAENAPNLVNKEAISYDLIHVCNKREGNQISKRSWAGVRQEIKKRAREEIKLIESGRYGNEALPAPDVNILLIGKCLELYSKHYGNVVDYKDQPVPIKEALEEIKMMVDQLLTKDNPLPPELEDIDVPSYIYLTALCSNKEITVDSVSKIVRGIIEPSELREYGIIVKGRESRGRTFEVKQPLERLNKLKEKFRNENGSQQTLFDDTEIRLPENILLVDVLHFLIGLAESGDNLLPWLEKFGGLKPQIRAALEYMMRENKNFVSPAKKVLGLLDERTLFTNTDISQQGKG